MINFDKALETVLDSAEPLASESASIADAVGRVAREDVYSDSDLPAFSNSAMDGFAARSSDTAGSSGDNPRILEVIEDIKAGDIPRKALRRGQAARIMTGAPIPKGADSVVMVEHTEEMRDGPKELIKIYKPAFPGENIRRAGEDIRKGELVISEGTRLNLGHIGILASLGRPKIRVSRRPTIAVLATGDELIDVDSPAGPGKIRSSNTYIICSQIVKAGCIPRNLGIAGDDPRRLEKKVRGALDCDIIITSGGVSVGKYDFVRDVLARIGAVRFRQVAIRPGKPLVFGKAKRTLLFGLPGNPVSGIIGFEMFVRSAIAKMEGEKKLEEKEVEAVLESDIDKKKGFRYFLRARTRWEDGAYHARTSGAQGSAMLKSMALANSLIILEEERTFVRKGTRVSVRLLD